MVQGRFFKLKSLELRLQLHLFFLEGCRLDFLCLLNFLYLLALIGVILGLSEAMREKFLALRVPRSDIVPKASAFAFALASVQKIRQVLRIDILQEFLLVPASQDVDLLLGLIIDPHTYHCPDSREQKWSVEDEHVPQDLRVVVLCHFRGGLDELVRSTGVAQLDVLHIKDRASLHHLIRIASLPFPLFRASIKDLAQQRLVQHRIIAEQSIWSGDLPNLLDVGQPDPLDVDGRILHNTLSYILGGLVIAMRVHLPQLQQFGEVVNLNFIGSTVSVSTLFFMRQFIYSRHIFSVSFKLNFLALKNRSR